MPEVSGDLITRNYSNFRGVDFSNTEVALYRSPDAINMWKDYKKMGTSIETRPDIVLFKELKNTVYGLFFYTINQVDHMIIHCGVSLYDYNMKTKELKIIKEKGMNIRKSQSFIYRNILYIKDGLNYLQYDGETCKEVIGYIPTTTIGKAPSGGGTTNQEVNLLTGVRENSFCADGESTEYVLDASELDAGYQEKVFINDVEKTEGFTVDKVSGKVNFTTAPEKPLTDGQDNVVIRFSKTIPGNRDKINKCTILEVFDNRVFFSGNQDYPNTVFHTMLDEPKYCSDLDYYNEGADISPVRGMVAGNNALWVIKEPSQANTAIFYHNPTIDSEAGKVYPSEHSSISTGCIGAAINFNDDIVYFSNRGMEGISGDITTEQVISHRSSLVDSKLLQEENYKDMILVEYEGYLLVIIKDKIYLADSRAMFTNENHNEYEWFYWNIDIEPTCAVVYNGELWLGSKQGIFKIGKASENNKEISMEKDEEERYFIDGVTKQETGVESYKTATGKEILIEDGENNKGLEIKVKGESTQNGIPTPDSPIEIENIEGKNKFDKASDVGYRESCSKTINGEDIVITSSIEALTKSIFYWFFYVPEGIYDNALSVKLNTDYTLSYYITNKVNSLFVINIFGVSSNNSVTKIAQSSSVNQKVSIAFNSGNYDKIAFVIYPFGYSATETIANNSSITISDMQLEEGTVATPYVPYNSLEFKVEGKNLFNINGNINDYIPNFSMSGDNTVENNILTTAANDSSSRGKGFKVYVKEGDVIRFSAIAVSFGTGNNAILNIVTNTKTQNVKYFNGLNEKTTNMFIIPKGVSFIICTFVTSNGTGAQFKDIIITKNDETATDYDPYKSQVVTFPLGEEKLMEGSYLADDGIHHKRKQVVLDGSDDENWTKNGTNQGYAIVIDNVGGNTVGNVTSSVLCNKLTAVPQSTIYNGSAINGVASYGGTVSKLYVRFDSSITTGELLRKKLAESPILIEYELAEEEIVPYTTEQQEAWNKIESMKLYDGVNHIESTSEIDIKYNYIYKKPSIKNKSNIENKISSGEYQTIINNKRYFVFLEEELKSVRNDITDRLYIDTNKNIAKVMKRVDKLVLNGTEEWNVNATHSNVFYTAKPKNMADNETNIFCTITDEFSKDLSGETYGILIDTNINIKIPKVKTVADLKAYLAKEPITIQYKATEEIKDIILLSKPSSYWTTCEDEFKYPQMQKTTNKRGCVADVIGEEIDVFCKTNKEQFEKIATHKNATGYAVNRIKKKKWKSIQLKFSSNKSFELFSCTLESYIGSYIKR